MMDRIVMVLFIILLFLTYFIVYATVAGLVIWLLYVLVTWSYKKIKGNKPKSTSEKLEDEYKKSLLPTLNS